MKFLELKKGIKGATSVKRDNFLKEKRYFLKNIFLE